MPTVTESTISATGSPDYSTLQTWEDAAPANLVTADAVWKGVIQEITDNFTTATATLLVSGSTTDATRYKWLTVKDGSSFADLSTNHLRYDESQGASIATTAASNAPVHSNENYFRMDRVQVSSGTSSAGPVAGTGDILSFDNCLFESNHTSGDIVLPSGTRFDNSIMIMNTGGGVKSMSVTGGEVFINNSTIVTPADQTKSSRGIDVSSGGFVTGNNVAIFGATVDANGVGHTFTTSRSDDATPHTGITTTTFDTTTGSGFIDINKATLDLRLNSTSAMVTGGTDDATNAAADIFGTLRTLGSYGIGAFQYAAAAAGAVAILFRRRRR